MISKLQRVPLKEVWRHEALDFTPWLQENIDVLNDVIEPFFSNAEREQSAGPFHVDIVAEDQMGDPVVIENQLDRSDHDHLGKLITYLTAINATSAVWIVADPRPEHVAAVSWLNEWSPAAFYLIKVEAVRIDSSPAAPLLTLIVGPSAESRQVGKKKKELAERDSNRKSFWDGILERAKQKTSLHANISPSYDNWVYASAGKIGLGFSYVVRQHDAQVELYVDCGTDSDEKNTAIYKTLIGSKGDIEAAFGEPLEWQPLEGKRACRIKKDLDIGGYRDEEKWPEIQEAMIDAMVRLEKAFKPHIAKLPG